MSAMAKEALIELPEIVSAVVRDGIKIQPVCVTYQRQFRKIAGNRLRADQCLSGYFGSEDTRARPAQAASQSKAPSPCMQLAKKHCFVSKWWRLDGCRRVMCWNTGDVFSGILRVPGQAARSIG